MTGQSDPTLGLGSSEGRFQSEEAQKVFCSRCPRVTAKVVAGVGGGMGGMRAGPSSFSFREGLGALGETHRRSRKEGSVLGSGTEQGG